MENSETDFSSDESDFEANELSQSNSSGGSYLEEDFVGNLAMVDSNQSQKISLFYTTSPKRHFAAKCVKEYIPQSDGYFKSYISKKCVTSDHTLNRLKNPRLAHFQLFSLLALMKVSNEHERCLTAFLREYKTYFFRWMQLFDQGYNIILYGLGSKRIILKTFHAEILESQPVIMVNGFFPSLTIKDIVDAIIHDMLEVNVNSSNLHEVVDLIEIEFSKLPETHLFLIVHNIDGPMLRNHKAQDILSRLASIRNIHIIASLDHINTPLLWNKMMLNNYNFSWWDVTSMIAYSDETSFENFMLVQNSAELALSSMNNVFLSLTSNARKIFMLIVEQQLKNRNDSSYQGIPFRDLYWLSRESFLVSSDLALRAQLTEFLDHKLVKARRTTDGTEHLKIPIAKNMLEKFAEQYIN